MSLSSYLGLVTAVGDWLERDDTATLVPDWIAMAESHMNTRLRVGRMISRSASFTVDVEFKDVPADFLAPRSMRQTSGDTGLMAFYTPEQMGEFKAGPISAGPPTAYAIVGTQFEFGPAPSDSVTVALTYYAKIPALTDVNTSNWVLANYPDAYLHGCLTFAGLYYADDAIKNDNATLFNGVLDRIEADDRRSAFSANPTPIPSSIAI